MAAKNPNLRTNEARAFLEQRDAVLKLAGLVADDVVAELPGVDTFVEALDSKDAQRVFNASVLAAMKEDEVHDMLKELVEDAVRSTLKDVMKDVLEELLQDAKAKLVPLAG